MSINILVRALWDHDHPYHTTDPAAMTPEMRDIYRDKVRAVLQALRATRMDDSDIAEALAGFGVRDE